MFKEKTKLSNKRLLGVFILLVLCGTVVNFISTFSFIAPSINITEEAPEEEGLLTEQDKQGLLEIAKAFQDPYMAWRFGTYNYYELICIVLACCSIYYPCVTDIKKRNLKSIVLAKNRISYFKQCYFRNFFRGGFVVILPTIISAIVYFTIFNSTIFPSNIVEPYFPQNIFSNLFLEQPIIYMLFYTCILFFTGATYATFGLAIAMYSKKISLGILIPFVYWYGGSMIVINLVGYATFEPWNIFYFITSSSISFGIAFSHTLLILILSTCAIYKKIFYIEK